MKINANFKTFASVHFDASKYIVSPSFGVNRFMLDRIGDEKARATTIVEYKPNSSFPEHEHIGGEEFLVLKGTFKDQFGEFPAGTYVRNPIGHKHAPWVDDDGCTIMVKLLQMADTDSVDQGTTPLYIHTEKENETIKKEATDYGSVINLYQNEVTGERVQMCCIQPNSLFPAEDYCLDGEELFLYKGSLLIRTKEDNDGEEEEYAEWGWLRFPAGAVVDEKRKTLKAGSTGAQVYRKMGHLTDKALSMEKIQIKEEE